MTLPNFVIIGAAKSGTTALYRYLEQHPQIYMSPNKEPKFFALEKESLNFKGETNYEKCITDFDTYRDLFAEVSGETAIGEASTLYLYSPRAPDRIKYYVPKAKLIVVLRDPAFRAYSHFVFNMGKERDKEPITDFAKALQAEPERTQNNYWFRYHYKQRGFYYVQLKRYFDKFDQGQIKVFLYEDLKENPLVVLKDIFRFLDIDDTFVPDLSLKYNVTYIPKIRSIKKILDRWSLINPNLRRFVPLQIQQFIINQAIKLNSKETPPFLPEVRKQLTEEYREDILKLEDLIQRDLSKWLD